MKESLRKHLVTILFIAGGALLGYLYYRFVGCASGSCAIASNPFSSMAYVALIGWLLSRLVTGKGCCCCSGQCDLPEKED